MLLRAFSTSCLFVLSAVASWFLSPVLSGIMSGILFYFIRRFILNKVSPLNLDVMATTAVFQSEHAACMMYVTEFT